MKNPYDILGISKSSSAQEIKQAFKKLAKEYHPDRPNGSEEKFKEINLAHEILKDPKSRQLYDQGGMDGNQPQFRRGQDGSFRFSFGTGEGFDDIIKDFFEEGPFSGSPFSKMHRRPLRNKDIKIVLNCTLEDLYFGSQKELNIQTPSGSNRNVKVTIPVNADSNTTIRFRGLGDNSHKEFEPGNLLVSLKIMLHNKFERIRDDLYIDYKVNIFQIITGGSIELDHISGFSREIRRKLIYLIII